MAYTMKGTSLHKGTAKHTDQIKDKYYQELKVNRELDKTSLPDGRPGVSEASPAKRADVYIDGKNEGTGPEAMAKGIAAEKANMRIPVGLKDVDKLKEVTYDKEDAKTRLKMATTDPDKKGMVKDYKTTGIVKGKGTERAEAAKSRDKA